LGWYAYNDNNILLEYGQNSPTLLLNDISSKIHEWLNNLKNSISLADEAKSEKFKMMPPTVCSKSTIARSRNSNKPGGS
jgi:hypothetical protein